VSLSHDKPVSLFLAAGALKEYIAAEKAEGRSHYRIESGLARQATGLPAL